MNRRKYYIWKCKDCNKNFKVKSWIMKHIDVGIDYIYCPYCHGHNTELMEGD